MAANTIITSVVTGGSNNHTTVASEANAIATDFISSGVVGTITLNTGSGGTGSFCVNQNTGSNRAINILAGQAYISATPSSQDAQVLRPRAAADYTAYTINANASGSTKYDWIYLSVDATKANNPAAAADDVTSIVTSRSSSNTADNGSPPTYGLLLAIVTVANGATAITNANITDARVNAAVGGTSNGQLRGWTAASETWVYSSYDSTNNTGVITVPTDATVKYTLGMRVKFTNNAATQYGIITKISSTTLTVYFGTDYSLTNATITSNYYSTSKAPFGFPLDPAKWTVTVTDSASDRTLNASPVSGTWYHDSHHEITAPIGIWNARISAPVYVERTTGNGVTALLTLSTANNTESDVTSTRSASAAATTSATTWAARGVLNLIPASTINVSSATTYYLNGKVTSGSCANLRIEASSNIQVTMILVCAYL